MENPIRAQVQATAGVRTILYTALRKTTVSSVIVCNVESSADSFDIAVALGNEDADPKQYLYYNTPAPMRFPFVATIGMTLQPDDVVYVTSRFGRLAFNLCGVEYD